MSAKNEKLQPESLSVKEIEKRIQSVIEKVIADLLRAAETAPPGEAEQLIRRAKMLKEGGTLIQGMQSLSNSNVALNSARVGYSFNPIYMPSNGWTEVAYSPHNSFAFYRMIKSMKQIMDPKSPEAERISNIFAVSVLTTEEAKALHDTTQLRSDKKTQERELLQLKANKNRISNKLQQEQNQISSLQYQRSTSTDEVAKSGIDAKIDAHQAVVTQLGDEISALDGQIEQMDVLIKEIDAQIRVEEEAYTQKVETLLALDIHRKKIATNHYAIIAVIIEVHIYLSRLYKADPDPELGRFKHELERIAYIYNLHNPALCIGIEHHQLSDLRIIKGTLETIRSYLQRKQAKANMDQKAAEYMAQMKAAENNTNNSNNQPNSNSVYPINSLQSAHSPYTDSMIDEGQIEEIHLGLAKAYLSNEDYAVYDSQSEDAKSGEKSGKKKLSIHAKDAKSINAISTGKNELGMVTVTIDSNDVSNPDRVLKDFIDGISALILQGLSLIDLAMEYGNTRKYNIFLNEFDSVARLESNVMYMEAVGIKLAQYLDADMIASAEMLPPQVFTRETYEKTCFYGKTGLGREMFSTTIPMGAKVSLRQKTTITSTTESEKSKTIADTVNSKTTKSLGSSTQAEARDQETIASEQQKYIDHSLNVGAEVRTPAVSAGVDYGVNTGSSSQTRSNREKANNVINNSFKNEVSEKSAQSQSTVTETTKEKMTETKEDGMMTEYENPNRLSPLEISIYAKLQEIVAFNVLTNINVLFENGIDTHLYNASEAEFVLGRFVKPDFIPALKERISEHCDVFDFKNRKLKLYRLDKDGSLVRTGSSYLDILQQNGVALDYEDMLYSGLYANINGIITSKQVLSRETPGTGVVASISPFEAADRDFIQRINDEQSLRQANIAMVQANVKSVLNLAEKTAAEAKRMSIENQLLEKAITQLDQMSPLQAVQSVFYLTHDNKQLVDRTFVGQMLPLKKEKDEDGDIVL